MVVKDFEGQLLPNIKREKVPGVGLFFGYEDGLLVILPFVGFRLKYPKKKAVNKVKT